MRKITAKEGREKEKDEEMGIESENEDMEKLHLLGGFGEELFSEHGTGVSRRKKNKVLMIWYYDVVSRRRDDTKGYATEAELQLYSASSYDERVMERREKFSPAPGFEPGFSALRADALSTKPRRIQPRRRLESSQIKLHLHSVVIVNLDFVSNSPSASALLNGSTLNSCSGAGFDPDVIMEHAFMTSSCCAPHGSPFACVHLTLKQRILRYVATTVCYSDYGESYPEILKHIKMGDREPFKTHNSKIDICCGRHLRGLEQKAELKWETLENRRRKARTTSLYRAHLSQKAWVDITARLEKPTYYGRNDHNFKIKCRKQKTDVDGLGAFVNQTLTGGPSCLSPQNQILSPYECLVVNTQGPEPQALPISASETHTIPKTSPQPIFKHCRGYMKRKEVVEFWWNDREKLSGTSALFTTDFITTWPQMLLLTSVA
ncbi:hypothetical protein ANN_12044 [Periplaneta americana]|uniref:Uncharacterized protein n=1 Tax=Periplaneta americana TaxID=6978 RepID=A0ABQ8T7H2_PERAM|nr:hypothetical protein ANN_12044 [Periplaneta americana]